MFAAPLRITVDPIEQTCLERELIECRLGLDGCHIVELGCGRADLTRVIATAGRDRRVLALEVDAIQHARNLQIADLPNVQFALAGAEAIPASDASFDVAFMFKSLHHVPLERMDAALREIARVLHPGGLAWLSEPIFAGPYNDIVRLFHDEQRVREAAFGAISRAVADGLLESVDEIFFNAPVHFADFAAFEERILHATHTQHVLSAETLAEVRRRFAAHSGPDGVRFRVPMRVDLLRKP
jgi:ubiquinone/menaquinone biosynthesis C-methylase UbiE